MGDITPFPTKRLDPLAFDRAISEDQVNDWERVERECFGITRRIALMTLARSRQELAEGFADDKAGLYEIADQIEAWKDRLKASLELADAAHTRLYIVSGDCPHCPDPTAPRPAV